jgi:two-component system cell cycle sensor histidine kinase/response regulator CckA
MEPPTSSVWGATASLSAALAGAGALLALRRPGGSSVRASDPPSEARYRTVVEMMDEGVVVLDADGAVDLWNGRALELLGVTPEELGVLFASDGRRRAPSIRADGSPFPEDQLPLSHTLRTGEPQRDVVVGVPRTDGSRVWLSVSTRALRDEGYITGVVCTFSDVTGRRELEAAQRMSEERFRVVSERVGSMIFDHDLRTGALFRSEALRSVFRWDASESTHEWWISRVHQDDRERLSAMVQRTMRDAHLSQWTVEYRFQRGDGAFVPVVERGALVRAEDGTPLRVIGAVMDTSDRAELASQLRQAQKMEAVGQLAGGIAHDFNNLLTAISCHVELLLDGIEPSDSRHDDVVQIREAAERAAALTRQLLAFSRRQVLQPRATDLNVTVRSMERLLRRVMSADVRLHTVLSDALPAVFADAGQMEQVVMNLVLNARDAMPGGGTVVVRTTRVHLHAAMQHRYGALPPGEYVALAVKDAGVGIAPDVAERLFEPFFTTKPQGKGTGLGLATVHGIVLQSSGQITVESEPGRGTEFIVYLPVHRAGSPLPAPPPVPREITPPVGRTVLVVDDEPAVRDVAMRAIARAGYRVIGASSGADALKLLEAERDMSSLLLLTDIMMPKMNGHELAEQVARRFPDVRVACMSGFSPEEMARQGLTTPERRLLHKPFTLPTLIGFVDQEFTADSAVR